MVPTPSLVILSGPTASGKTALALELVSGRPEIEIINADSLLIYRGMNIGTAKPSAELLRSVPHHLIDIREPHEPFTAGDFHRETWAAIQEIESRGKRALIVGGTGFYLKALLYGLWQAPKSAPELRARLERETNGPLFSRLEKSDPASALRIGPNDRYRLIRAVEIIELSGKTPSELEALTPKEPDPRLALWVVDRAQEELDSRIEARTRQMIESGLVDEVRALRERYPGQEQPRPLSAVGYREVGNFLDGRPPEGRKPKPGIEGLRSEISLATRQLVKSQRTWFRGQKSARWFVLNGDLPALREEWRKIYG